MTNTMMNKSRWTIGFFTMLLLVALMAGCTSTSTRESTGEYIDDTIITSAVKGELYSDQDFKVGQISVETYKGVVQLSGFVNSAQAASKAVSLAKKVKGVRSVKNSLVVK
jgi:osmotically-inducible protein OsmY